MYNLSSISQLKYIKKLAKNALILNHWKISYETAWYHVCVLAGAPPGCLPRGGKMPCICRRQHRKSRKSWKGWWERGGGTPTHFFLTSIFSSNNYHNEVAVGVLSSCPLSWQAKKKKFSHGMKWIIYIHNIYTVIYIENQVTQVYNYK